MLGCLFACALAFPCAGSIHAGASQEDASAAGTLMGAARETAGGLLAVARETEHGVTWPVVPGSAGMSGKPPKGAAGAVLIMRTTVPGASPEKSTRVSARSARPINKASSGDAAGVGAGIWLLPFNCVLKPVKIWTTLGNRLCSAPIW